MKCIYFYDNNQEILKETFEDSLKYYIPDVELLPIKFNYLSASSNFGTLDFRNLMLEKVSRVKEIILQNIEVETEFLISDIDIIVYNNFSDHLILNNYYDIIFQKENRNSGINTGFIYLKCSQKTHNFWELVEKKMQEYCSGQFVNEQAIINNEINNSNLKWKLFNDELWAYSNQPVPENVLIHHANCTVPLFNKSSLQLKCEQLILFLNNLNHPLKHQLIEKLNKYL